MFKLPTKVPVHFHASITALFSTLLFNWPIVSYINKHLGFDSEISIPVLIACFSLVWVLTLLLFFSCSLIHKRLYQLVIFISFSFNACALYYLAEYGVFLDKSMMGNIFNTRGEEAFAYFDFKVVLYWLVFGLIPIMVINNVSYIKSGWKPLVATPTLAITFLVLVVNATASASLWIDKHAKYLGGLTLPWSYIINGFASAGTFQQSIDDQVLLEDATLDANNKTTVVLIIGETARAANFKQYGYQRNTTPYTDQFDLIALPNASSCSTYTTASLRCILSHTDSSSEFATFYEPLPSYLHRMGVPVTWVSNNWGEPPIKVTNTVNAKKLKAECTTEHCQYDGIMTDWFNAQDLNEQTQLFVFHQKGSHGPTYFERYPNRFETFTPVCKSADISNCDNQQLINGYDNSLIYTDFILAEIINKLKQHTKNAAVLYVSDHGESLGENGMYLHGTPKSIAPEQQYKIPMLLWLSDELKQQYSVAEKPSYDQGNVFHTLVSLLGITTPVYDQEKDILTQNEE